MDARGDIYAAPPGAIPAEDKARLHERIREWDATLRAGGGLQCGPEEYETSLMMATVRRLNGLGPDRTDANGESAMAEVRSALD